MSGLRQEAGYSLVELITVMAIMGVVLAGLTSVFTAGSKAETDVNKRFQAQSDGRLALDRIRRDAHCAQTATTTSSSITFTMPTGCKGASNTTATWCTNPVVAGTRYVLYRYTGASSCTSGIRWADYVTQASLFTFTQSSSASLAKVQVAVPINLAPGKKRTYTLKDDIYLRNSLRVCVTGSPSPPC